jgi:hypothetical protein
MITRNLTVTLSMTVMITLISILMMSPVLAAKPHFSISPIITKNSNQSITANFNAAALGKKVANVTLSSHATADIQCVNPGGHSVTSKKLQFEQMQVSTGEVKPKNGKIKGALTLGPPNFPSALDVCPNNNWSTNVLSLTYENPVLHIKQKNSDILNFTFGNVTQ